MKDRTFDDGDADVALWRQLLEIDLALEDGLDLGWDESDDLEAQARVFEKVGISATSASMTTLASFHVDIARWLASQPQTALARDVGSIADSLEIELPELARFGLGDEVELECDVDARGRISDLAVLLRRESAEQRLELVLIESDDRRVVADISAFGLARFTGLEIDPARIPELRFEVRG